MRQTNFSSVKLLTQTSVGRLILLDDLKAGRLYDNVMKTNLRDYLASCMLEQKFAEVRQELANGFFT
jgi:hypothetical protein